MRNSLIRLAAVLVVLGLTNSGTSAAAQGPQPTSAGVLSEHHLEVLDAMTLQAQAEFLIERAINRYRGANEQIAARAEHWRGKIALNERLNGLFRVAKGIASVNRLEVDARHGEQGPRANALWRIGLLGNRGVQPERAFEILMSAIHDDNVNVRY